MKRSKRILTVIGVSAASIALLGIGGYIGKRAFIEKLIHDYEAGRCNTLVDSFDRKKFGHLIYEVQLECIGD